MKKFNAMIILSCILYVLASAGTWLFVGNMEIEKDKIYRVEINRIYNSLSSGISLDKLDLRSCRYVKNVSFLDASGLTEEETVQAFMEEGNRMKLKLMPLFEGGLFRGVLRFEYEEPGFHLGPVIMYAEVCLFLMWLLVMAVLLYVRYQVLNPLKRLNDIPDELANGHFKGIIKEEKNQLFTRFLRGIGRLKDELDMAKKRELELNREKKKMLLSLSHDIKTPLNTIKLYGKALEEKIYQDEEKEGHAAHQIGEKAAEIERYVEAIMKSAREEILNIQVEKGEFYLEDLMKKILGTYAEKCHIRVVELTVGDYSNRLLKGDLERSVEVFENIFENAFKYGDGRRIEITFYEEDYCQLIRIFNTGEPVSETEFNHIFESFFRGTGAGGMQGNGLGLYICREIMRKMEGEIFAQKSEDGMAFVLVYR